MPKRKIEFDSDDEWMLVAPDGPIRTETNDSPKSEIEFDSESDEWMLTAPDGPISEEANIDSEYDDPQPSTSAADPSMIGCGKKPTNQKKGTEENLYEVLSSHTRHSNKFKADVTDLVIKIKEIKENPQERIKEIFDSILDEELKEMDESSQVGIALDNENYHKPLYVTLRRRDQLTSDVILAEVEKVLQSNENFFLDEPLKLKIMKVHTPNGQKRLRNLHSTPFHEFCEKKNRTIAKIINSDNLCLPRAIAVAKAHRDMLDRKISANEYRKLVRTDKTATDEHQRVKAVQLCRDAGINLTNFKGDLADVNKFQQYFKDQYEITVFDGTNRTGRKLFYKGNTNSQKYIDLILGENHYNVITNIKGAFTCNHYCRKCNKGYDHINDHRCRGSCVKCRTSTPCDAVTGYNKKCARCGIYFTNPQCFENHREAKMDKKKSVCDITKFCYKCNQLYTLNKVKTEHKCGYKVCTICKKYVPREHLCHVQVKKQTPVDPEKVNLFVFFDFEARLGENQEHIPNFCVIQNQCTKCSTSPCPDIESECQRCGTRQYIIDKEGDDLIEEFFSIICGKARFFDKVYVFAHNGGGYDFQFIINFMIMKKKWTPKIISNGSKIVTAEHHNLCFKDTLYFFNSKLATLPKMFDIKEEVKGYFPHFFNKPENYDYIGEIPEAKYYGSDYMSFEDREKFLKWHANQTAGNVIFNFKTEMLKYCKSDVDILRKASLKFQKLFTELLNVDPLISSATIASACMKGYRSNFLPVDTIGVMDFKTYSMRDNQSKMALRYLLYLERKYDIKLQSAYRGLEKQFGQYKVDGYYEDFPTSKLENFDKVVDTRDKIPLIVEIHGCLFHGCTKCYGDDQRSMPLGNKKDCYDCYETLHHRYQNTVKKMDFLRHLPIRPYILEIWECEIREQCTIDEALRKIMVDEDILKRIESNREAFFGGRTECFKKYHKADSNEEIRYIDVNSLYPFVNKYGIYPIHHPEILTGDEANSCQLDKITGLAKVKILPPKQLLYPILPTHINQKLLFSLCTTCARLENKETCEHNDEQRSITGTYTCVEIAEAIKRGYKIQQIYEVWAYESTQFDKTTGQGGIFVQYIDKFLKIKQMASGYPSTVCTDEEKEDFCSKFEEKEGIPLHPSEVQPNPGMRSLSKLCLNSLWGKFGQRNRMMKTDIMEKTEEFYSYIIDPEKEISLITLLTSEDNPDEDIALVTWKSADECSVDAEFINPVVSAYVTAQARLHLLRFLERLGERTLYCDTDSVIYIHKRGDPEIETGSYLGEMGNEMEAYGPGCYIQEFVCEGPKNYGYVVVDQNGQHKATVAKVRGFSLNYSAGQVLNFETMKKFVTHEEEEPIKITEPHKIQRKKHFKVVTQPMTKAYKPIKCKRRRIENYQTVPYGWVDEDSN